KKERGRRSPYEMLTLARFPPAWLGENGNPEIPRRDPLVGPRSASGPERRQVPNPHGAVLSPGDEVAPAGVERDGVDPVLVFPEDGERRAGARVPDADGMVLTPRGQPPAVGGEGKALHPVLVAAANRGERAL